MNGRHCCSGQYTVLYIELQHTYFNRLLLLTMPVNRVNVDQVLTSSKIQFGLLFYSLNFHVYVWFNDFILCVISKVEVLCIWNLLNQLNFLFNVANPNLKLLKIGLNTLHLNVFAINLHRSSILCQKGSNLFSWIW